VVSSEVAQTTPLSAGGEVGGNVTSMRHIYMTCATITAMEIDRHAKEAD